MGANDGCADKICYGAIPYKSFEIRNLRDSVLLRRSGFYVFFGVDLPRNVLLRLIWLYPEIIRRTQFA